MSNEFNQDNINWAKIDEVGNQVQSTSKGFPGQTAKTIFGKFKGGTTNRLRVIPVGDPLENVPFMELGQHSLKIPITDPSTGNTTWPTVFCMCWQFVLNNLLSKQTQEEKKNNSLLGFLKQKGKINEEESEKFQTYGCPFCKGHEHLEKLQFDKDVRNKLYPKHQWIWNVQWKFDADLGTGDNKIYVWGISKGHFNTIITAMRRDRKQGVYTFDPNNGFDIFWTAKGEGLMRRYDSPAFDRMPSRLDLGGQAPFNLAEVMANSFKPYQEMVNILKKGFSDTFRQTGYVIPGDIALQVQYGNPMAMSVPQPSNQAIPVQAQNFGQHFNEVTQATQPQQVTSNRKILAGGWYEENGMLYKPNGEPAF